MESECNSRRNKLVIYNMDNLWRLYIGNSCLIHCTLENIVISYTQSSDILLADVFPVHHDTSLAISRNWFRWWLDGYPSLKQYCLKSWGVIWYNQQSVNGSTQEPIRVPGQRELSSWWRKETGHHWQWYWLTPFSWNIPVSEPGGLRLQEWYISQHNIGSVSKYGF